MNRLITIEHASERYDRTEDNFRTGAFLYKQNNGELPSWYVFKNNKFMIDTYEYEYKTNLERRAWTYATDELYWLISEVTGLNDYQLAKIFSQMSGRKQNTWHIFLRVNLFNLPPEYVGDKKKSMRLEFVQLGTRLIYNLIKSGKLDHFRYNTTH